MYSPPHPPQTPAASPKSPYRKCPAGTHSGLTRMLGVGPLVDRVLRFNVNASFLVAAYSLRILQGEAQFRGVRLDLCRGSQWLILCSPYQKPQDYCGFPERYGDIRNPAHKTLVAGQKQRRKAIRQVAETC